MYRSSSFLAEFFLPRALKLTLLAAGIFVVSGCGEDYWFGEPGPRAHVITPDGRQTGDVPIEYVLEGDDGNVDVKVSFSTDGVSFQPATPAPGSELTTSVSASHEGDHHVFLWDSAADLGAERHRSVIVRVYPDPGHAGRSQPVRLHNAFRLVGVRNDGDGRVDLLWLNPDDRSVARQQTLDTGGKAPYDVLFHRDEVTGQRFYFIVHEISNDVAVFRLDEENEVLVPVQPPTSRSRLFGTYGDGSKYLATDGNHLFVSNVRSGTLSIFEITPETGALRLHRRSGVRAPGCGSIAVWNDRLCVSSAKHGQVLVFEIRDDGSLRQGPPLPNYSGVPKFPHALVVADSYLYVGDSESPSVTGFTLNRTGEPVQSYWSPSPVSLAGTEQFVHNDGLIFGVSPRSSGRGLLMLGVTDNGMIFESPGSPFESFGPSSAVQTAADVVVFATTTGYLGVWTLEATRSSEPGLTLYDAEVGYVRLAISD